MSVATRTREQRMRFLLEDRIKLATVSGIWTTKPSMIRFVDDNIPEIELITSKSYQVLPNSGNREPIIVEIDVGNFGNAVGLKNPGMEKGYEELYEMLRRRDMRAHLNISLSANSIDDFKKLIEKFESIADFLELNFSCPHAKKGFGSTIGSDAKIVAKYMKELRKKTKAILIPKLTPNVDNIGEIAIAAVENGADGIAAINTVGPEVYIEPHTGKPLLYNPKGHKGGKSGEWIREIGLERVAEVRKAVGDGVPIIGMAGVTIGEDVRRMRDAGANVEGVGTVTGRVPFLLRPDYFSALKKDAGNETNLAGKFVSKKRLAEYKPYKIRGIEQRGDDLRIFKLKGEIEYKASQFAFIWVPEVGEKPFSIVRNHPLTFVVKRREYDPDKEKGLVTHALFELKEGDELMIRGPCGAEAPVSDKYNVYIVAGGTGIAVVPKLAKRAYDEGKNATVYYGITSPEQVVLEDEIRKYADFVPITDNEVVARVLDVMNSDLNERNLSDSCFYNIGPVPFMKKAMEIQEKLGVEPKDIYSSIETNNMCGIGMCSECVCGDRLTCQDGTFFSLEYLKEHKIDISDFE
ncbi:dihydroorotate dehydrogenase [Candidatus Woesearchaeota archaeon]|nr:dihydroorotate dehydrogenase [Candidatus Woesearchaeota archaeon]